jgi:DNA-binding MurR/RpiR family transcriptional regulator
VTEAATAEQVTVLERIAQRLPYLNPALRRIGEFILERPAAAKSMTITELASACDVAESSVSRFVKEIGLDRYQALRVGIAEALLLHRPADVEPERRYVYEGITRGDSGATLIGKIARGSHHVLRRTAAGLDPDAVDRAVGLIESANTLIFCSMGSSSIAADNASMRFTRAGKKCLQFHDQSLQVTSATIATPSDAVVAISDSGGTTAVIEAVERARSRGVPTIAITSDHDSTLSRLASVTLFTSVAMPDDTGLYGEAMTSKWGQILVLDVLYAAFAVRNFDATLRHLEETYAAAIRTTRTRPPRPREAPRTEESG